MFNVEKERNLERNRKILLLSWTDTPGTHQNYQILSNESSYIFNYGVFWLSGFLGNVFGESRPINSLTDSLN